MALAAIFSAALIALPPAFAMDIMERVITTQTQLIRREATEYQRKVAEANAHAYMAAQLHPQHHASTAAATGKTGDSTAKAKTKDEAQDRVALKKKLPHYVAIDTPKDKRCSPGTKKDVMIWDTQSEALVSNNVYDVTTPPAVGSTAKFDTYSAQYVGNGL